MSDLGELYQELVLDHNRRPRNFRRLEDANRTAEGYNPICGDIVCVDLKVEGNVITDIGFQGSGCAISKSSASLMTDSVKGKTEDEVEFLFDKFHELVTSGGNSTLGSDEVGKLAVFSGVQEFPGRVKCAILPWHTLRAALEEKGEAVSTE